MGKYYPDWEYIEMSIKNDYIYLYMVIPPKYAVSKVTETIKKEYQQISKEKISLLEKGILGQERHMGERLFLSTVGINKEVIRRYVESQEEEETGQAKLEF